MVDCIRKSDRIALAKMITMAESDLPVDRDRAAGVIRKLAQSRKALRIAITGAPGVGKSTFIDALGEYLIALGHKIAVLATDPSSIKTGGSILGDKTRMIHLSKNKNAFIRPSPNSGLLGGLNDASYEASLLCEAAGFDIIFVETIGVGQAETEAEYLCDIFVVLLQPSAGDQLQGMKRGIMEVADLLVVNKWDGNQKVNAESTKSAFQFVFENNRVLLCSALEKKGLAAIWERIEEIRKLIDLEELRKEREIFWFRKMASADLFQKLMTRIEGRLEEFQERILKGELHYTEAISFIQNLEDR